MQFHLSALHVAVKHENTKIIQILLKQKGINVGIKDQVFVLFVFKVFIMIIYDFNFL